MLLGFMLEGRRTAASAVRRAARADAHREDLQFHPPRHLEEADGADAPRSLARPRCWSAKWTMRMPGRSAARRATRACSARRPAVGEYARHLLQMLDGRIGAFQPETLARSSRAARDVPGSSRALGWDTMLPTSSCGTRMSPRAFGHTGFTGTSLWIDPDRRSTWCC